MPETLLHTPPFFAGYLQFDIRYGQIAPNFSQVRRGLAQIAAGRSPVSPGIIVLPELWATDFAYERLPELVNTIPDLLQDMRELAAEYQVLIAGSLPEYHDTTYYNTLFITGPAGVVGTYRKQHLFSPMAEDTYFTPADNVPYPMQTPLGSVAGLVCYDLRFPELVRRQAVQGANILVISAQWPAARINHWRILIQARAIENQMFVVAANRCGTTNDTLFGGHSMIVGPDGSLLLEAGENEEYRGTMINPALVDSARSLFSTVPKKA